MRFARGGLDRPDHTCGEGGIAANDPDRRRPLAAREKGVRDRAARPDEAARPKASVVADVRVIAGDASDDRVVADTLSRLERERPRGVPAVLRERWSSAGRRVSTSGF